MSRWMVLVVAACASPAFVEKPAPQAPPMFSIGTDRLGPLEKSTPANLTALRELLGKDGYTVKAINDGGVELHVYDGAEHLLYVIPNDDGSLFNVHVVSGSIPIVQHPEWVVGKPFTNAEALTFCECWGPAPMCWKEGDHVALGFQRECGDLETAAGRKALVGIPIQRAVWSPQPFGVEANEDDAPAVEAPDWVPHPD